MSVPRHRSTEPTRVDLARLVLEVRHAWSLSRRRRTPEARRAASQMQARLYREAAACFTLRQRQELFERDGQQVLDLR